MSNVADDIDDDDDNDGSTENLPKALRQQNKKLAAALQEATEKMAALEAKQRKVDVGEALKKHGAPDRIARYYDGEDTSADAVLEWLKENGADFGWELETDDEVDETLQNVSAISRTSSTARGLPTGVTMDRLRDKSVSVQELGLI